MREGAGNDRLLTSTRFLLITTNHVSMCKNAKVVKGLNEISKDYPPLQECKV